jgi:hypothetical protein
LFSDGASAGMWERMPSAIFEDLADDAGVETFFEPK